MKAASAFLLILLLFCPLLHAYHFSHFSIGEGVPSSEVYQAIQDKDGFLWFATDRGVCRYDGTQFKVFTQEQGLTDNTVFGFCMEESGRLWFYTYAGGICYYENGAIFPYRHNGILKKFLNIYGSAVISSIFIDARKQFWIGTFTNEIIRIDADGRLEVMVKTEGQEMAYLQDIDPRKKKGFVFTGYLQSPGGTVILRDSGGQEHRVFPGINKVNHKKRLMFSRLEADTFIMAQGNAIWKVAASGILQHSMLPDDALHGMYRDANGDLWIGTFNGIFCYPGSNLEAAPKHYLEGHAVTSAIRDHEGGLWFTTLDDGIFYLPGLQIWSRHQDKIGIRTLSILVSNSRGVYGCTADGHLIFFEEGDPDRPHPMNGVTTWINRWGDDVAFNRNGNCYLARGGTEILMKGCRRLELRNDSRSGFGWSKFGGRLVVSRKDSIVMTMPFVSSRVKAVAYAGEGDGAWIGSMEGLFYANERKVWEMGNYYPPFANRISDLDFIDKDHLLVTTRGNGVYVIDVPQKRVTLLRELSGYFCTSAWIDEDQTVWIASFSGLTRIEGLLSSPEYYIYTTDDGLISNEVFDVVNHKGRIWVATGAGISIFDKGWLPPGPNGTGATITGVQVNGRDTSLLSSYRLPYDANTVGIDFNQLSYRHTPHYFYRVAELHSDWIETNEHRITFSALKPGRYTVEISAAPPGQSPSPKITVLRFLIAKPLWRKTWFIALLIAVPAALIFIYLRSRYLFIRKENKLYRLFIRSEQKALRAQVNPHFIFNAFGSILELLMDKQYKRAADYLQHFSALMRKVLENSRNEDAPIAAEIALLKLYVQIENLRFDLPFSCEFAISDDIDDATVLIPSMLLQPYVENAIMHGVRSRNDGKGRIDIGFSKKDGQLLVTISDNGVGYAHSLSNRKRHTSFGLKINEERLKLSGDTKNDYQVEIISPEISGGHSFPGTIVRILLPFKKL